VLETDLDAAKKRAAEAETNAESWQAKHSQLSESAAATSLELDEIKARLKAAEETVAAARGDADAQANDEMARMTAELESLRGRVKTLEEALESESTAKGNAER
jgi:chromosome segregation ATPase